MKAIALIIPALLTGCATSEDYRMYLAAQENANVRAYAERKPLVEIEAVPGQQITGLKAMRVYLPEQPQKIEQMRPSEWAGIAGQALSIVGMWGGIYYSGKNAVDIANAVGSSATRGYGFVQPPATPQANVTTTTIDNTSTRSFSTSSSSADTSTVLSGRGVIGNGIYSTIDQTATPTVVTQPPPVIVTPLPSE